MFHKAVCTPTNVTARQLRIGQHFSDGVAQSGVEPNFCAFDENQVHDDHSEKDEEEAERQTRESKSAGQRREGNKCADHGRSDGKRPHRDTGAASEEWSPPGSDDVNNERLRREAFNEPSAAKLRVSCMQDRQHHPEGREIEERTDGSERDHESADE